MTNSNHEVEKWDLVIEPKRNLWDFQLHEVWHYRDLVLMFVRRDFVSQYKQTILGPIWFLIQPLLTSLTFTVIFGNIANLPTDGVPDFLFYLSGTVVWNYFANCLKSTSDTFITNSNIFGKIYFPRLVMPISVVISSFITFFIQFIMFLGFLLYFIKIGTQVHPTSAVILLPLLILLMAGMGLGFGIIISSLTTKYRDLRFLVTFGINLWMYITPVIYPKSTIPEHFRWIADINPLTSIIETFRTIFLGVGTLNWSALAYSTGCMLLVCIIGILIFNRVEKTFIDTV
jgi:lipopolysaccharide transport system permease protein